MMPSKMSFALSRKIILDLALIMKSADQISSKMAVFELNIYIRAPYTGLMFFLHFFIVSSLFIHLFIISLIHSFNYSFIHFSIFISHLTSLTSFSCYSIGFGLAQGVFPKFLKLFFQSRHVLRTRFCRCCSLLLFFNSMNASHASGLQSSLPFATLQFGSCIC